VNGGMGANLGQIWGKKKAPRDFLSAFFERVILCKVLA